MHEPDWVEFTFANPVSADAFAALDGVDDVVVEGATMTCVLRAEPDGLLKAAAAHRVLRWEANDRDLDDLFLDFYRETEGEA